MRPLDREFDAFCFCFEFLILADVAGEINSVHGEVNLPFCLHDKHTVYVLRFATDISHMVLIAYFPALWYSSAPMANVREDYIKQSASLSIRLRPAELDKIKALAKKAKKTIAEFVRERCLNGK